MQLQVTPLVPISKGLLSGKTSPQSENTFVNDTLIILKKCKPHKPDKVGQEQILKFYGSPGLLKEPKCDDTRHPEICSYQLTKLMEHEVSCHPKVCGFSEIQVASVDPQMGKAVDVWETLPKDTLTYKVQEAVKTNLERGFTFLFLRCGNIYQALSFPPVFKENENAKGINAINVNIIMLDSVSRPHFYRIMPKATEALRKILEDSTIKATFLDFELVQSIGQQTFENLRPFFSGVLKGTLTKFSTVITDL